MHTIFALLIVFLASGLQIPKALGDELILIPLQEDQALAKDYKDYTRVLIPGPAQTFQYDPDPENRDALARPISACAFFSAVENYNQFCEHEHCRVQFGDFYHATEWGVHTSHGQGDCVDVRPIRTQMGFGPVNYVTRVGNGPWYVNPLYDPELTQVLVDAFIDAGATQILFNDTKRISGVRRAAGHSDHLHVCFPPNLKPVQEACNPTWLFQGAS